MGAPLTGRGNRPWLAAPSAGERAHYELAAGHLDEAKRLLHALGQMANEGGLLPEQLGRTGSTGARVVLWQACWFSYALGLGPCRIPQALPLPG